MLLSIDPGADCGWALFLDGKLWKCGLRQMPAEWPAPITRLVVERPHTGITRARKKDIITLALRAGEVAGIWSYILRIAPEYLEPARWKGSLSKEQSHGLTKRKMRPEELAVFQSCCKELAESKHHNVLDAIGIGFYILRR